MPVNMGTKFAVRPIGAAAVLVLAVALACAFGPGPAGARKKGPQTVWRFPVKGAHDFSELADTGFGVQRPDGSIHRGQDILAGCGQPLVAAHRAEVRSRGYSDGTGYYVVLHGLGTRFDFVYAHMKGPGGPRRGKVVKPGRRIGHVGDTGTESGICHLHFELWSGRWFEGGRLVDPLPHLHHWDKFS
jgi:murein DD-endopeptidase MepM/ murein hydrolase activator NlpD